VLTARQPIHDLAARSRATSPLPQESDHGHPRGARRSARVGAQVVSHAVIPAVTPQFVGLLLYRFDVNVRSSLVLGLVGAGGIGFLINESIKLFRFDEMLTHIIVVLALVVVVDNVSALIRRRIQ